MKKIVLFFAIAIVLTSVGCVGPRTGSVGYRNTQPILTTNLVGTVTSQQVGDQLPVMFAQTNFTITSTSPVQQRTWREKVFGQRPPEDSRLTPPFPNAGVYGTTATGVTVPQGRMVTPQRTSGPRYGIGPNGAKYLLPGRYGTSRFQLNRVSSRRTRTYATVRVTAVARGRVNVPMSGFERSALGHATSIDPYFRRGGYYGTRVKSYNATVVVAGGGQFRSGLRRTRR